MLMISWSSADIVPNECHRIGARSEKASRFFESSSRADSRWSGFVSYRTRRSTRGKSNVKRCADMKGGGSNHFSNACIGIVGFAHPRRQKKDGRWATVSEESDILPPLVGALWRVLCPVRKRLPT